MAATLKPETHITLIKKAVNSVVSAEQAIEFLEAIISECEEIRDALKDDLRRKQGRD